MLGSLYRDYPGVAVIAMIPIFSLSGLPPLSGFIGKLSLVRASFEAALFGPEGDFIRGRIDDDFDGASLGRIILEACRETRSIMHEPLDGGSDRLP